MGYNEHYRKWHNHEDPDYIKYMQRKFARALEGQLPISKDASILEIGCANGMALYTLQQMGYRNMMGIEIDDELADIARNFGLTVLNEDGIEFLKATEKKFDLIYLFDVLEHVALEEIPTFLKGLYDSLNENGRLVIITPNATSLVGSYFRYIDWTHTTSFTPTSIMYLLESSGFDKVVITDDSIIEHAQRTDYADEESYIWAKGQSEKARFYEAFARGLLVATFGNSPYNKLVAPNMKVVGVKQSSTIEARTCTHLNTDELPVFDFHSWVNQIQSVQSSQSETLTASIAEASKRVEELQYFRNEVKMIEQLALEAQHNSQRLEEKVIESIHSSDEAAILNSFDLENLKSQFGGMEHRLKQATSMIAEQREFIINLYRRQATHRSLLGKIKKRLLSRKLKVTVEQSGLFDSNYYLEMYPDVKSSNLDPISHFILFGAVEGRNPSVNFNTDEYILTHPDMISSGMNPIIHAVKSSRY